MIVSIYMNTSSIRDLMESIICTHILYWSMRAGSMHNVLVCVRVNIPSMFVHDVLQIIETGIGNGSRAPYIHDRIL